MPVLKTCCGASLEFGTYVTGVLGIIIGAVTLVFILVTDVKMKTIVIDTLPSSWVKVILAINLIMTIFISILLIIGAKRRNRFMMLPWVILAIMLAIGMAISVIYTAVEFFIAKYILGGFLWLIFGLVGVAVYIYLWWVVLSYLLEIEQEKKRHPYFRASPSGRTA